MNSKEVKLSPIKIVAIVVIGIALSVFSFMAIATIVEEFIIEARIPYLYGGYIPYRQLLVIGVCMVVFVLMLLFNMFVKHKWLSAFVNIIVIIALCNPITFSLGCIVVPKTVTYYTIESEAEFNQCADDMSTDFSMFPKYNELDEQNVQIVGKVDAGFFFYQSITAIVKYDSLELCEADYKAYIDSHQFLTEPVIDFDGDYLIAAPEFHCEGIFFKVLTAGEDDYFPNKIYMIGIDKENSTLYYLYLDDFDLDYIAEPNAHDLEGEMAKRISDQFNLGK
ncbi:MAG: hypothetical protein U0K54_06480 [Acutalibacteraceae bacterium]|nr:hypothetical protein [Acutalibacteraceae bacterium]